MNPDRGEALPTKLTFEEWLPGFLISTNDKVNDESPSLLRELYAADYEAYGKEFNMRLYETLISITTAQKFRLR
jgi:hypothetical protein